MITYDEVMEAIERGFIKAIKSALSDEMGRFMIMSCQERK
jgi:hypothetical protein